MEELEASYRKSKAPEMPQSMRDELNNLVLVLTSTHQILHLPNPLKRKMMP